MTTSHVAPLRMGLPKGRFLDFSLSVLASLGCVVGNSRKSSWEVSLGPQPIIVKLLKVQDVTLLLHTGKLDIGVSADEWMEEMGVEIPALLDLAWCVTNIVVAVPVGRPAPTSNACMTIATCYPNITRNHFRSQGRPFRVLSVTGATEALVPEICDAIVDCVETGKSLQENRLQIAEVLMRSSVRLYAHQSIAASIREALRDIFERHRCPNAKTPAGTSAL